MRCSEVKEKWDAYLDGDVSKIEQQEIQKHIEWCQQCRMKLGAMAFLLNDLQRPRPFVAPVVTLPKQRKNEIKIFAIAASILILLSAINYFSKVFFVPLFRQPVVQKTSPIAKSAHFKILSVKSQFVYSEKASEALTITHYSYRED